MLSVHFSAICTTITSTTWGCTDDNKRSISSSKTSCLRSTWLAGLWSLHVLYWILFLPPSCCNIQQMLWKLIPFLSCKLLGFFPRDSILCKIPWHHTTLWRKCLQLINIAYYTNLCRQGFCWLSWIHQPHIIQLMMLLQVLTSFSRMMLASRSSVSTYKGWLFSLKEIYAKVVHLIFDSCW